MSPNRSVLYLTLFTAVLPGAVPGRAQSPNTGVPLSLEEVVKLSQTGVSEDVIITKIKKNAKAFDLSADEIADLKKSGISDNVIKFLLDPSQPYTPSPPPPPPVPLPANVYHADAYAAKVPLDPGLYHFLDNVPLKTDIKLLLGEKAATGFGKVLMKKGKTIAYLLGPASKTRILVSAPIFYVRLPEGKGIEEVVLVVFEQKKGRREMQMEPSPEAMRQFDSIEVGPRLFKVTANKLAEGEYLFFLVGSAEPSKDIYGKGWDFGIETPTAKPGKS